VALNSNTLLTINFDKYSFVIDLKKMVVLVDEIQDANLTICEEKLVVESELGDFGFESEY
jgi:hypothetical protein